MSIFDLSKLQNLVEPKAPKSPNAVRLAKPKSKGKKPRKNALILSTKLDDETRDIFSRVLNSSIAKKEVDIAEGKLDRHGNPLGTEYWDEDEGAVRRKRRKKTHVTIKNGMRFGELIVLRKGNRVRAARPNLQERWRCQCSCGKQIIVPKYYLLRQPNPKTHCGHLTATLKSQHPFEYRIYMMVHQRCYNPKHGSYEHYSSRGITLHEEWNNRHKDGFKKFFEHVNTPPVGPWPGKGYSLDRVNNNKGYEPGNLRWATSSEQRQNQGDRIGGYTSEEIADLGLTEEEFVEKIISGEIQ